MPKQKQLQQEDGDTFRSFHNAEILLAKRGKPLKLDFKANKNLGDYSVTVTWADGTIYAFMGFAWGYGGTAPEYLNRFFKLVGIADLTADKIPIDKFGKTDVTYIISGNITG